MRALPSCEPRLGPYQLLRLIGTGGMAEVYEAQRAGAHGFSRRVAIKRLQPHVARDPMLVAMFCDEARIHARLAHPNLVQVLDFGEHEGELYMVLELVDGLSCGDLLCRVLARKQHIELGPALYIAREVLQALAYAHSVCDDQGRPMHLVHRDVAPTNILIGRLGEVKLGDFGIARALEIESRTAPGELKGKVGYVSPEQAMGLAVDARSDLFSLAVVLAELVIGEPLFAGENDLEILRNLHDCNLSRLYAQGSRLPADLVTLLDKSLSMLPARRYATAKELSLALDAIALRHGVTMTRYDMAEWLADLGLIKLSSEIRERPAGSPPRRRLPSEPVFEEEVTLAEDELVAPAPVRVRSIPPELAHATVQAPLLKQEPRYRVQRPGDRPTEPIGLPLLVEGIATGRWGANARVCRNDGPFAALTSVIELAQLAGRPGYRFFDPIGVHATERWSLRRSALPRLMYSLVKSERTGLLCVRTGAQQKRFYFSHGVPWFSSSTDPSELFGAVLVQYGRVTPEQVEEALVSGFRRGRHIGQALVDAGRITADDVSRVLVVQRHRRLAELLRWPDIEALFVDGAEPGEQRPDVHVPPLGSVTRAVLDAFSDTEIDELLGPVADRALELGSDAELLDALELVPAAHAAVARAGVGQSLMELELDCARSRVADSATVARGVFVALAAGVLHIPGYR